MLFIWLQRPCDGFDGALSSRWRRVSEFRSYCAKACGLRRDIIAKYSDHWSGLGLGFGSRAQVLGEPRLACTGVGIISNNCPLPSPIESQHHRPGRTFVSFVRPSSRGGFCSLLTAGGLHFGLGSTVGVRGLQFAVRGAILQTLTNKGRLELVGF